MPVQRLRGTRPKPTLVAPHPRLCLGVRGCSNVTLLAHVVAGFSCQDESQRPAEGDLKPLNEELRNQRVKAARSWMIWMGNQETRKSGCNKRRVGAEPESQKMSLLFCDVIIAGR